MTTTQERAETQAETQAETVTSAPNRFVREPDLYTDYDEDGPIAGTLRAGWDLAFGCRVSFGPSPDGSLNAVVSVSDDTLRDGIAAREVTADDLRTLAAHLHRVADEHDTTHHTR